jgi:hypothetical protein
MKLKFANEDKAKCLEIFKAIASKDRNKSYEGQEALAALVGPIVDQVLSQAATSRAVYEVLRYDMSEGAPSIPIDTYFGNTEGALLVWNETMAGGLASQLVGGADEYRFTTHRYFSAVSFLKKYVEAGRLDVLSKGIERLAEEVLLKTEYANWYVLLAALAGANAADGLTHIVDSQVDGVFTIADLNRLATTAKRLRKSWAGGTPLSSVGRGVTDLFVSPEIVEDIRAMAYNPMNVTGLPDAMRQEAWNAGGAASFLGYRIHELLEFGVGQQYSYLFDQVYSGIPAFAAATQEFVLGVDTSITSAVLVEATNSDDTSVFSTEVDDQFANKRSGKVGWFGSCEQGNMVADVKAFTAVIV